MSADIESAETEILGVESGVFYSILYFSVASIINILVCVLAARDTYKRVQQYEGEKKTKKKKFPKLNKRESAIDEVTKIMEEHGNTPIPSPMTSNITLHTPQQTLETELTPHHTPMPTPSNGHEPHTKSGVNPNKTYKKVLSVEDDFPGLNGVSSLSSISDAEQYNNKSSDRENDGSANLTDNENENEPTYNPQQSHTVTVGTHTITNDGHDSTMIIAPPSKQLSVSRDDTINDSKDSREKPYPNAHPAQLKRGKHERVATLTIATPLPTNYSLDLTDQLGDVTTLNRGFSEKRGPNLNSWGYDDVILLRAAQHVQFQNNIHIL